MTAAQNTKVSASRLALTASSVYFVFEAMRMVAGFVSMPILTRALTKEEYGLFNLAMAVIGIISLVARLGFGEATIRFYYERARLGAARLREFCSTMLAGSFVSALAFAFVAALVLMWVAPEPSTARCLRAALVVAVIRTVLGVLYQFYRCQERAVAYSLVQLATRYLPLTFAVGLMFVADLTAVNMMVVTVIGEGLVALFCVSEFIARGTLGRPTLSRWHVNAAVVYGMPLAVGNYSTFLLDYGDRFLIERFWGLDAVAAYAVPYDLVSALAAAGFGSLKLALVPIAIRLWESEGRNATSEFVSRALTYCLAFAIPAGVLFVLLSKDLVVLLASAKYTGSAVLIPYLLPGVFLGEMGFLVACGLMLSGRTMVLATLSVASGILNVALNVLFLPRWGLAGAAYATTTSYGLLILGTYLLSRSILPLRIKPLVLFEALLTTAVMVIFLTALGHVSDLPPLDLLIRGAAGAAVAIVTMSLLDRDIRTQLRQLAVRGEKATLIR